jgi:FixJ family two-component response regulator
MPGADANRATPLIGTECVKLRATAPIERISEISFYLRFFLSPVKPLRAFRASKRSERGRFAAGNARVGRRIAKQTVTCAIQKGEKPFLKWLKPPSVERQTSQTSEKEVQRMKALLALSDPASVEAMRDALAGTETELEFCPSLAGLRANFGREKGVIVFCQARLPDGTYQDLLNLAASQGSKVPIVLCSDFFDKTTYIEAMSSGAYDYIVFPYRRSEIEWIIGNVLRRVPASKQAHRARQERREEAPAHAS